jgi:hypothetical protein
MKEIRELLMRFRFGPVHRLLILFGLILIACLELAAITPLEYTGISPDVQLYYKQLSTRIRPFGALLLFMLLITETQSGIRAAVVSQREADYQRIVAEIVAWFKTLQSPTFDPIVVKAHTTDSRSDKESKWTQSIAVGSKTFIETMKEALGFRAKDRKIICADGQADEAERSM